MGLAANRFICSTDFFPQREDERARKRQWHEFVEEHYANFEMSFADDRRLFARLEAAQFGPVTVDSVQGTLTRGARTARHVAADGDDNFCIELNCGPHPLVQRQHHREVEHGLGSVIVLFNGEPGTLTCNGAAQWRSVYVPRRCLTELVSNPEDLIARPIDISRPIVRHLRRYVGLVLQPSGVDSMLEDHVAATLVDLVALCLGAGREQAALAKLRGLRRARLAEILAKIKSGFADPAFSASSVALQLGLTPRYVQDLLHDSGQTFSERVLELRLQKARAMLSSYGHDHLRVNEIAYGCGFNDVSHFNRCFRRRFGAPPGEMRKR